MVLQVIYPNCCGIDVHKTFVFACIAITDNKGIPSYYRKRFSTFTHGLRDLAEWLEYYSCFDVCMESTGKYWIPVWNVLETAGIHQTLAHPKYVRAIRGKKTDKKDAKWIADLFRHDLVVGSFMPPALIRQLRDLIRYRWKLGNNMVSEKNRFQNSLTVSNIQLASVVSDTFGVSAQKIIKSILDKKLGDTEQLEDLIHGSLKKKLPELELAVDGAITSDQEAKLRVIMDHYKSLVLARTTIETEVEMRAQPLAQEIALVRTVPGLDKPFTAISVLAETGVDMSQFPDAKHLCSWAGLTPTNNESAGKKHSVRISKAGAYLKPLLVQVANGLIKSDKHPEIKQRYQILKKRRGHKKTIIAIARQLLTAVYHILANHEVYNPKQFVDRPERSMSVREAVEFAKARGFDVLA